MQQEDKDSIEEAKRYVRQFRRLAALSILVLIIGVVFYRHIEGWSWVDSAYFCVVSLATVGYGDLYPTTDTGKIFTIFYLLVGLGIFAGVLSNMLKSRQQMRFIKKAEKNTEKKDV